MKNKMIQILKTVVVVTSLISSAGLAATVENVKVLKISPANGDTEVQFEAKYEGSKTTFFVDIVKADPKAKEKLDQARKKFAQKDKYHLDLDIISFSASPSGSRYSSDAVIFTGK